MRFISGIAALLFGVLTVTTARAGAFTIDTTAAATANVLFFGVPDTANFGETFTAPNGAVTLNSFAMVMKTVPATAAFRGELYAWDPGAQRPTGPNLYESAPVSTTGPTRQTVTFTIPGGAPVTGGQQYIFFVSTAKDQAGHSGAGGFAITPGHPDPGGGFVALASGPDPTFATVLGNTWDASLNNQNLGIIATFAVTVPTMTDHAMLVFAVLLILAGLAWIGRRHLPSGRLAR